MQLQEPLLTAFGTSLERALLRARLCSPSASQKWLARSGWLVYLLLRSVCTCDHMGRLPFTRSTSPLHQQPRQARRPGEQRPEVPLPCSLLMSVALGLSIALGPAQSTTCPHTQGAFCWLPRKILSNFPSHQKRKLLGGTWLPTWVCELLLRVWSSLPQGLPALSFLDLYSSNCLLSDLGCGNHMYCVLPCLGEASD